MWTRTRCRFRSKAPIAARPRTVRTGSRFSALPIAKALDPDTIVALAMNGEPLTPGHGAPIRLIVPRWYGMASVKWLRRIEVLTHGSTTWQPALLDEPLGPHAWRGWKFHWRADEPGRHTLRARAIDASGARQPEWSRFNRDGYGNNAIRPLVVEIV